MPASSNSDEPTVGRRSFLKYLLGFSFFSTIGGIITPILGYLIPPASGSASGSGRVLVGTTTDIPIGVGKVVPFGNKPVIITNTNQGVKAFSAICTHLGCICIWDETRQLIICPCHDGQFNPITGSVIAGPPPGALPVMQVTVDGEDIYIGEA